MMIIDSLPYLLHLVKQNILIHALVMSGAFSNVDFKNINYERIGNAVLINDYPLSKTDTFNINCFRTIDNTGKKTVSCTTFILSTKDSTYFEKAAYFFNDDENRGKNRHPLVKEQRKTHKDFGTFKIFDDTVPAFVTMTKNLTYGYAIFITFYSDFDERYQRKMKIDSALEEVAKIYY